MTASMYFEQSASLSCSQWSPHCLFRRDQCKIHQRLKMLLSPYMFVLHLISPWLSIFVAVLWSFLQLPFPVNHSSICAICCIYRLYQLINKKLKCRHHFLPVGNELFVILPVSQLASPTRQDFRSYHMLNMQCTLYSVSAMWKCIIFMSHVRVWISSCKACILLA